MKSVGIIANPASGKDIRRLVAYGSVFSNSEKINIMKRVLLGMDSVGVEQVYFMPDSYGLARRALDGLDLNLETEFLEMRTYDNAEDSTNSAAKFAELGVSAIVVLGGDGTNRVVAKASGDVPLISIATGTNNVFSHMIEGTLAGVAAGIATLTDTPLDGMITQASRFELWQDGELVDIALVDVVVSTASFVGSRAIWDESTLKEVFLTQAEPGSIGFSSLGGQLCQLPAGSGQALHIVIGRGKKKVKAPIAPGLIRWVPIKSHKLFKPGEALMIEGPTVIALDGERELTVPAGKQISLKFSLDGPLVIDASRALACAQENSLFLENQE